MVESGYMKKIRVAINGFGRIGRAFVRQAIGRPELEVVALNDLGSVENLAYLLKYDTVYKKAPFPVESKDGHIIINGTEVKFFPEKSPELQPYIQQLQQMLTQQHIGDVMLPLFNMFTQNTTKEGGISPHVNNLLDKSIELGVKAQFSKILCYCNNFSLAKGRSFQMGMEDLAGAFPETLYSFNNILSAFTELNS
jgi:hypothetical protein